MLIVRKHIEEQEAIVNVLIVKELEHYALNYRTL